MAEQVTLTGPDLGGGVDASTVRDGEPVLGHADGEAVLRVRRGDEILAIGATCTHYGGPLAEGRIDATRRGVHGTTPASTCVRRAKRLASARGAAFEMEPGSSRNVDGNRGM